MELNKFLSSIILVFVFQIGFCQNSNLFFEPGKIWSDTKGYPIEAHGGGILKVADTYYWYGENHKLGFGNKLGISCYSSTDLLNWNNEGVVFPKEELPTMFRDSGVCERPKVLYNAKTKKYVMWMHLDANNYTVASAGIAISDKPYGPFKFIGSKRPIKYEYPYILGRVKDFESHEKELGNTFRDMNLFLDDDGKAYLIYSSEELVTLYCVRLNDDFTDIEQPIVKGKTWERILPNQVREAPVLFKYNKKYYILSSGTSGWNPNASDIAISDSIFGPFIQLGNPCIGDESETTFRSQSTCIIHVPGNTEGQFIYMGDRWDGKNLQNSTYVWLPFKINKFGKFQLVNFDKWNFSFLENFKTELKAPIIEEEKSNILSWQSVDGAHAYKVFRNGVFVSITNALQYIMSNDFYGNVYNYTVQSWNLNGVNSLPSNAIMKSFSKTGEVYLSDMPYESSVQGWGNLQKDKSIQLPLINIAGKEFKKGLGTHANSQTVYRICGNYKRFTAWVGVDYFTKFSNVASIQFKVIGDGLLLFESTIMKAPDAAVPVDIDITGINELKLIVTDGGDGTGWDHANWADAKITP